MNTFKTYRDYMKDNPQGLWFKRKLYGWGGWVPARWQGWLVVLLFVVVLVLNSLTIGEESTLSSKDLIWFFARVIFAVFILMIICYKKGEKPRWQWGAPEDGGQKE